MGNREEKRNLETIPVGSLGIIALEGCRPLGEKVDQYLVKWRAERESEHKESLAFAGYQRDSCPRTIIIRTLKESLRP